MFTNECEGDKKIYAFDVGEVKGKTQKEGFVWMGVGEINWRSEE